VRRPLSWISAICSRRPLWSRGSVRARAAATRCASGALPASSRSAALGDSTSTPRSAPSRLFVRAWRTPPLLSVSVIHHRRRGANAHDQPRPRPFPRALSSPRSRGSVRPVALGTEESRRRSPAARLRRQSNYRSGRPASGSVAPSWSATSERHIPLLVADLLIVAQRVDSFARFHPLLVEAQAVATYRSVPLRARGRRSSATKNRVWLRRFLPRR